MPRRRRLRRVVEPPKFRGYKPYGHPGRNRSKVELLYEEYEAIKLADYDLMNHQEASELMGVSRATFARIYESARRKIARALVESKEIITVFGNAYLEKNWFVCDECNARFTIPAAGGNKYCPMCKSAEIKPLRK
ncbi:MAG: DUF134 domain-containing protein [Chlorobi bacterium]|nr:DUF134 domain-containing protein [Chlorobiota bacterium]